MIYPVCSWFIHVSTTHSWQVSWDGLLSVALLTLVADRSWLLDPLPMASWVLNQAWSHWPPVDGLTKKSYE